MSVIKSAARLQAGGGTSVSFVLIFARVNETNRRLAGATWYPRGAGL